MASGNIRLIYPNVFEPETDSKEEMGRLNYTLPYKSMHQNLNAFYVSLTTTSDT